MGMKLEVIVNWLNITKKSIIFLDCCAATSFELL